MACLNENFFDIKLEKVITSIFCFYTEILSPRFHPENDRNISDDDSNMLAKSDPCFLFIFLRNVFNMHADVEEKRSLFPIAFS